MMLRRFVRNDVMFALMCQQVHIMRATHIIAKGTCFRKCLLHGGGCRIRTRVEFPPNGFQDRPVMTASVTLRILSSAADAAPADRSKWSLA